MMEASSLEGYDNFLKVYLNPAIEEQVLLLISKFVSTSKPKHLLTIKDLVLNNKISQNNRRTLINQIKLNW